MSSKIPSYSVIQRVLKRVNGVVMEQVIKYINILPTSAVFWIEEDGEPFVYINHTGNLKHSLGKIAEVSSQFKSPRFGYISCAPDQVYKLTAAELERSRFVERGYTILNQEVPFIQFKAVTRIDADKDKVLVYLVTSRRRTEVVGVFRSVRDAEEFVGQFYGCINNKNGVTPIVYANNEHTRKYWQLKVYKPTLWGGTFLPVESSIKNATQTRE